MWGQHGVSTEKALKLLETVRDYELKDRCTGVYDAPRDILKTRFSADAEATQGLTLAMSSKAEPRRGVRQLWVLRSR